MTGRHTGPIQKVRTDAEWDAHVRATRTAAITVGVLFAISLGVLVAVTLNRFGVI